MFARKLDFDKKYFVVQQLSIFLALEP